MSEAPEQPRSKVEEIKDRSNFLRGTIREGLGESVTGAVSESDSQLTKFHGIYLQDDRDLRPERRKKKLERAYIFMARTRLPGGKLTPAQWLAFDRIATDYGNGTLRLTTRQSFQFHGIIKTNLKRTIKSINEAVLDTLAACGDVNRNVMCSPNPDLSSAHAEVYDLARTVSNHLAPRTRAYHDLWIDGEQVHDGAPGAAVADDEPIYGRTYLPRKFKIVIAVPPTNDVDVHAHDLGFIAIVEGARIVGYTVTVGGGMGMTHGEVDTYPRLAEVMGFCTPEQVVDVAEKIVMVQRDFGDRTNRKHARLKYTIADRGLDWFRAEVEKRLGYALEPARPYTFERTGDRFGWARDTLGRWHCTLYVESGRLKDAAGQPMRTGLREIARIHDGAFVITPNQNLIIAGVAPRKKAKIERLMAEHGIGDGLSGIRLNAMACVALPTCGQALAEAERALPGLVAELEEAMERVGLRDDEIVLRMTGCPNGCARPYLAEIGIVGKDAGVYNVYLGGAFEGHRPNRLYRADVKHEALGATLAPLLEAYARERHDGERFGDFVIRAGHIPMPTGAAEEFHKAP